MRKHLYKGLLLLSGALCFGVALTGAACASDSLETTPAAPAAQAQSGYLHVIESGSPENVQGEEGDACLVVTSGEFWQKTAHGWIKGDVESYTSEADSLVVTYTDGSVHTYSVMPAEAGHEHTKGTVYTVYDPKCVIPGIGVWTCEGCHASFAEILPAVAENHSYNEENYGKCDYCGYLESGVPGFEVNDSSDLADVFEKVEDGDTVVLKEDTQVQADSSLNVGDKNITVDVKGKEFSLNKEKDVSGYGSNLSVEAGGTLTFTDSSEGHTGSFNVTIPEGGGNYADEEGHRSGFFLNAEGTEENRAQVNFKDVEINIQDENTMNVVMSASYADVTLGEGTVLNVEGVAYTAAMYVADGADLTIDGAQVNTKGDVTPFIVGNYGEDANLTLKSGEIHMEDASDRMFGVQVNGGGHFNMEGGTIRITGDLSTEDTGAESSGSCVAIGVENRVNAGSYYDVVPSSVNITGGEIVLAPINGTAFGIVTWPGDTIINFSGTIVCNATESGYAFAFSNSDEFAYMKDPKWHPTIILSGECSVQISKDSGRNYLYDTKKNGSGAFVWNSSNKYIYDNTADHRFGEEHKDNYGEQFLQPYIAD